EESASASEELAAQAQNMQDNVRYLVELVDKKSSNTNKDREEEKPSSYKDNGKKGYNNNKQLTTKKRNSIKTGNKNIVVSPEDVIPLEDDMGDF
ncbi:MAG: hypothetical protein ACLFPF_11340, partial [Halanaerobiales bacterium]